MCANNYLGLADHPALIAAAKEALTRTALAWRVSVSSAEHRTFTRNWKPPLRLSWHGRHDTLSLRFDANGGLFETLLTEHDAVISDELNHASIIDGIRLCKAQRFRYGITTWQIWKRNSGQRKMRASDYCD